MGGAQPLAVKLAGGVSICVEVDASRIQRRLETRYLDEATDSLEKAIRLATNARQAHEAMSIGLLGNAAEILPRMVRWDLRQILLQIRRARTIQCGDIFQLPEPMRILSALRTQNPEEYTRRVQASIAEHVQAILEMQRRGAVAFDYGNNLRTQAKQAGVSDAFSYPGFVPAFIRDSFCEGRGPFRWVALSGDPADIAADGCGVVAAISRRQAIAMSGWASPPPRLRFKGCRPGFAGWDTASATGRLLFNQMVRDGRLNAPIVIGRDHLDAGSVASPFRETEAMLDGSDAVSDWALLNFATGIASGAAWMSFHHGGGVGMGYSQHAGLVAVADGSDEADERLKMCLTNDPAMGVMRHADAGYRKAQEVARDRGLDMPSLR